MVLIDSDSLDNLRRLKAPTRPTLGHNSPRGNIINTHDDCKRDNITEGNMRLIAPPRWNAGSPTTGKTKDILESSSKKEWIEVSK